MKRFFSYFIVLILILSFATACSDTKDDSIVSADVDESWKMPIVSVDEVVEDNPPVTEETRIWYEFEGFIVSIDAVDGVTQYMLYDSKHEIVLNFIPSDAETAYADEVQVGNHVNIYIYGEEGSFHPNDIDGKTVVADIVIVLDTFGYAFYAEIIDLGVSWIQVDGLEMNSVNYRDEYAFKVYDSTIITDHYGEISINDLNIGDTIVVYSFGSRQETEPARLTEVQRIIRINDD